MSKYKNGKIYTLVNKNDSSLIYVGITIQTLSERFKKHIYDYKRGRMLSSLLYSHIIDEYDWDEWNIYLYMDYPCNSLKELQNKELEVIKQIGLLNKEYY